MSMSTSMSMSMGMKEGVKQHQEKHAIQIGFVFSLSYDYKTGIAITVIANTMYNIGY